MLTPTQAFAVHNAQAAVLAQTLAADSVFTTAEFRLCMLLTCKCYDLDTLAEAEKAMQAIVAERTGQPVAVVAGPINAF